MCQHRPGHHLKQKTVRPSISFKPRPTGSFKAQPKENKQKFKTNKSHAHQDIGINATGLQAIQEIINNPIMLT